MEYRKSLVILSGERGRSSLTVETTSQGSFCRTNILPLPGERLYLAVKSGTERCALPLDRDRIQLPFDPDRCAHYIVISSNNYEPVFYGTQSAQKLWRANMTDGVVDIVKKIEFDKTQSAEKKNDAIDKAQRNVARQKLEYDDEAIAEVNYYSPEYDARRMRAASPRKQGLLSDKIRRYLTGYNEEIKPSAVKSGVFSLQRKYLLHGAAENYKRFCGYRRKTEAKPREEREESHVRSVPQGGEKQNIPHVQAGFYECVKNKLGLLFDKAEHIKSLEERFPMTKWVRVPYENKSYYVVGILGDRPDYICYGVPGVYSAAPPEEIGDGCKWMPFDPSRPQGKGLWLMYQDANTGESVR